ncbi:MAG: BolA family transcriptional regulator [Rhodospirillales bacterium]|nr:BolA family transcriptional regulator [Rhodospirillales bacterium]
MAMSAAEIKAMIREAFPDAAIEIEDLRGDGDHYAATVTSHAFEGKSRVQQHQAVYQALKGRMGGDLHALALTTRTPAPGTPSPRDSNLTRTNLTTPTGGHQT